MDGLESSLPPRRRGSAAVRRIAVAALPYVMAGLVAALSAVSGFLAAQFLLPSRVTTAEAQILQINGEIVQLKKADSVQTDALNRFAGLLNQVSEKLDAGHRQMCIDAREKALKGDRSLLIQLDSAEIDCAELLGNRIRS